MPRRFASQVHLTVSRLLRGNFIAQKPAWYDPVLQYPPISTPPRTPSTSRTPFDSVSLNSAKVRLKHKMNVINDTWDRPKAEEVVYLEDRVRRQFFKDHPFEAFRARSLVENDLEISPEHEVQGKQWTRLAQRGRNPTPEDAIKHAINLHQHHKFPLSLAYKSAVREYRALRSEHDLMNAFAAQEAEFYGATFGPSELDKGHELERKSLLTFLPQSQYSEQYASSKLPWTPEWKMPGSQKEEEGWSRGIEYQERAEKGIIPDYHPDFTKVEKLEPVMVASPSPPAKAVNVPRERDGRGPERSPRRASGARPPPRMTSRPALAAAAGGR